MLKLVSYKQAALSLPDANPAALNHHRQLLDGYLQSHLIRNHAPKTINETRRVLQAWFDVHGTEARPLYTWEAMKPVVGRKRIVGYGKALLASEVSAHTVRRYLGILRGYFSYVLEHPFVFVGESVMRICDLYHSIEQPVSEYDMPAHVYGGETLGVPFDPAKLYGFYDVLRKVYLGKKGGRCHTKARNYAMVVLAGESGLRADEVLHLETARDLFFESKKIQTRCAKATHGSGKRSRVTLFTPLARDTIQYYLKNHRPHLKGSKDSLYLFPAEGGQILTYATIQKTLQVMKIAANKNDFSVGENMSWHWFRRLFATRFIERFPHQLPALVLLLGHVTPNTVHAYIRHSEAWTEQKILDVLEGAELDSLET